MKARQQQEIADAVMSKVEKELENPKVLDQILKQAVSDVESKYFTHQNTSTRTDCSQKFCSNNRSSSNPSRSNRSNRWSRDK